MRVLPFTFAAALATATLHTAARADDACAGWFCKEEKNSVVGLPVSVELTDGAIIAGVLVEATTDHVTLHVNETTVTIAWTKIAAFRAKPEEKETPPPPARPAKATTEEATEEHVDEAPKPLLPPPAKRAPPAIPTEREPGLVAFGVRAKLLAVFEGGRFHANGGNVSHYAVGGVGYELSLGLRLSRALMLRGAYEHAELSRGDRNLRADASPTSYALGVGIRALVGPERDVRGILEAGIGYRWLHVPYVAGAAPDARASGGGTAVFEGKQSLRAAIGLAFPVGSEARFEMLVEGAVGEFARSAGTGGSRALPESERTTHFFGALTVGIELGP